MQEKPSSVNVRRVRSDPRVFCRTSFSTLGVIAFLFLDTFPNFFLMPVKMWEILVDYVGVYKFGNATWWKNLMADLAARTLLGDFCLNARSAK